jgi:hypothetical protein
MAVALLDHLRAVELAHWWGLVRCTRQCRGLRTDPRVHGAATASLRAVAVDPGDPERLIAGGTRLYVSEDGGATLRPAFYADLELAIEDVVFDPVRPGVAYAAAACSSELGLPRGGRGVLRTSDGGRTWSSFAQGLDDLCVHALATDGKSLYAGTARAGVQRLSLDALKIVDLGHDR